jgi:hypothetical protein
MRVGSAAYTRDTLGTRADNDSVAYTGGMKGHALEQQFSLHLRHKHASHASHTYGQQQCGLHGTMRAGPRWELQRSLRGRRQAGHAHG